MFQLNVEMLGDVGETKKGFIAEYLIQDHNGKKHSIKVFAKDRAALVPSGKIVVKNDFFFAA
jgi:hypothetical protein